MEERLQKIMARAGYGSRRNCEDLISSGHVKVNDKIAVLGSKANPIRDKIMIDGKQIISLQDLIYLKIYKPRNIISSVKPQHDRLSVRDLIPLPGTFYPVGRLDVDSEGLLLLTNDGDLTNRLTHPRFEHEKEYLVLVAIHPNEEQLNHWRMGVVLEDGFHTQPAKVEVIRKEGKGMWLSVILKEGHKRHIREVGKVMHLPVVKIIRIRMGTLELGNLKPGQWRHLTKQELAELKKRSS